MTQTDPLPQTSLTEAYVQDCFHSYLKSSLTQAKAERLLGTDILSSAEADLMITGPALCLFFAALRSTTDPPSVPLPRLNKSMNTPTDLSLTNCPEVFRPFLIIWSQSVPAIQSLSPEHQHDLARIICNLSPLSNPPDPRLNGISADLRAVAIEISMRRTFQDRYAVDLQAAIDAGSAGNLQIKASFVPPPVYEDESPSSPPPPLPARSPRPSRSPKPPNSPKSALNSQAIEFIRETLYAALADVLERVPSIRRLLRTNPSRAYFSAVSLAILDVASYSTDRSSEASPSIRGVLGKRLTLSECPVELQPFMKELCSIGRQAWEMTEEDSVACIRAIQQGREPPLPRLERARSILEGGVGRAYNDTVNANSHEFASQVGREGRSRDRSSEGIRSGSRSPPVAVQTATVDPRRRTTSTENRAVAFANRINALSLGMTKLRAFKERQEIVFQVLVGVGG